jgi:S-disulfanyl-L-cysteine oxidoreductase SoxD
MTTNRTSSLLRWAAPLVTFALALALAIGGFNAADADEHTPRWFTAEQAERGAETYASACAQCHGDELQGNPPLVGETFLDRFDHVWAFYDVTRETMPQDDPGSLADETYGELVAFVLERNGFAEGDAPLDVEDRDALEAMELDPALVNDEDDG